MELQTHFASSERTDQENLKIEYELVSSIKVLNEVFGAIAGITAILNHNRQLIFANNEFLDLLGIESLEPVLGSRPGEAVGCIHSIEEQGGCGTSSSCVYCGVVNAIIESQRTKQKTSRETRLTTMKGNKVVSWDLIFTSTPILLSEQQFYIITFQDVSDEKRRSALERIFFHDLLNSAGGLSGLLSILKEGPDPEEIVDIINLSEEVCSDIIDEIISHRQIRAAERGDLEVNIERLNSVALLDLTVGKANFHKVGQNKNIVVDRNSAEMEFETDRILLQRVLTNLLKNALEATENGGTVRAGIKSVKDGIQFWVKNDSVMPENVKAQIFQRSFSTKGQSRGIGSYSIKMLTENYLHGTVNFVSNQDDGTIFTVEIPI